MSLGTVAGRACAPRHAPATCTYLRSIARPGSLRTLQQKWCASPTSSPAVGRPAWCGKAQESITFLVRFNGFFVAREDFEHFCEVPKIGAIFSGRTLVRTDGEGGGGGGGEGGPLALVLTDARAPAFLAYAPRGRELLPAPAQKEQMQGVRGREHLSAQAHQEQMQAVPRGGGHVDACRPGGARGSSACCW